MDVSWSSDFSYSYLEKLLRFAADNFECHVISEARNLPGTEPARPVIFIRHDIDVDPLRAAAIARIECNLNLRASYMVMTNSPLYRLEDPSSTSVILQLLAMGHEVGLHLDFGTVAASRDIESKLSQVRRACERLESIIQRPVESISLHRPSRPFFGGPLIIDGRVNAYSSELTAWYLSDSAGSWREGEPLPKLLRLDRPSLQILIHPIWWGDEHMSAQDRLQGFFEMATTGCSPEEKKTFDAALAGHLVRVRRAGLSNTKD